MSLNFNSRLLINDPMIQDILDDAIAVLTHATINDCNRS
ncbi:hypothetical protein PL10110_680004 [Planktothrix agardhii]|nr:hypothetical protein PL10110_680004 [Planktothrix agardhii]